MIDNRSSAQPVRVAMRCDDPEDVVRFTFAPGMVDVPPGQAATTTVTLTASRAPRLGSSSHGRSRSWHLMAGRKYMRRVASSSRRQSGGRWLGCCSPSG